MRIILLTQYFPPEVGAPQNRLFATATALAEHGARVTVLTAMPNYPEMRIQKPYRGKFSCKERMGGVEVIRAWLLVSSRRAIPWRLLNYFSFVISSLIVGIFRLKRSDVLLVESPPLFLGISAMMLARLKGARLVFNVSDLWPQSAVQLGLVTNKTLVGLSTALEMRCYRRSALITGQTQGIVEDIRSRCPGKRVIWIPNGVDTATMAEAAKAPMVRDRLEAMGIMSGDVVFAYAGILGHAQGLDVVLKAAALLRNRAGIHFLIIGDGPERDRLIALKRQLRSPRVHFLDKMPRMELIGLLRSVSGVVVPLRSNDLFKGAIPSKIFEALALGKPLLLGVEGEAHALFIQEGRAGLPFVPEDAADLARQAERYADDPELLAAHGRNGLDYVRRNFDRRVINERLWTELNALTKPH